MLLVAAGGCSSWTDGSHGVPCSGRATRAYADYPGVDPDLTSIDLYLPASGSDRCVDRPLVVWVHGGAWHEGDKTDHIADKAALFTEAGYVFASVNYRLTDGSDPPTPQYPVHDQDVADAIAWLSDHANEFGVDPGRVAAFGHSAGGGIVAAVATDPRYLDEHGLDLDAIRCAGSIDGEGYDIAAGAEHPDPRVREPYLNAFGSDPVEWTAASPLEHIAPGKSIPDYLVVSRGPSMRLELHHEFIDALRGADVPVTVVDATSLDHETVSADIGKAGDTVVTPPLMAFLDACFAQG